MNEWQQMAAVGAVVALAISPVAWALVRIAGALVDASVGSRRAVERERRMGNELIERLCEKLTVDPQIVARIHAGERTEHAHLDTSLQRDEIPRRPPTPSAPPIRYEDDDGVDAVNPYVAMDN